MANPPITIGSFDNVPAPGSPIRSDWPQEISTMAWQHEVRLTRFQMSTVLVTTDASGICQIFWNTPFNVAPVVVVTLFSTANFGLTATVYSASTTSAYLVITPGWANKQVGVYWHAFSLT
jgi:hypothetical protein